EGWGEGFDRKLAGKRLKQLEEERKQAEEQLKLAAYFHRQVVWLQDRFPEAVICPVPGLCKVVTRADGRALYFSRSPIPHGGPFLLHLGVYAYRVGFLKWFAACPQTPAELSEKLEQLRVLETGHKIAVAVVDYDGAGIDTPDDYAAFVRRQGL
ncbi:MAG: hypothetical protein WCK05_16755, partial [Planctomycetota bacterium]